MDFEVHRIRAPEWPKYRQLRLEALTDAPTAFVERYDESSVKPDSYWQERVERAAAGELSSMFVAEADDELVAKASGFVEQDITDHVSVHVVGVYTTPRWRGRGASDAVMNAVIGWARDDVHADRIRLYVTDAGGRAAGLYRRLGFVASGATLPYPHDPSIVEHELEYQGA